MNTEEFRMPVPEEGLSTDTEIKMGSLIISLKNRIGELEVRLEKIRECNLGKEDNEYGYTTTTITAIPLSEAEVWLRCYTALLTLEEQTQVTATYADDALEEYKKRYGKDE